MNKNLALYDNWSGTTSTFTPTGDPWWTTQPYEPVVQQYYPIYYPLWNEKNKTEQAFKIVQQLIHKQKV